MNNVQQLTPGEKISRWLEKHIQDREGSWSEDALAGEIDAMLEHETKALTTALEQIREKSGRQLDYGSNDTAIQAIYGIAATVLAKAEGGAA